MKLRAPGIVGLGIGLLGLAVVFAGGRLRPLQSPAPAVTPLNIVLVSIDTLRADHVGCYGYHRDTTPNMDRLARKGHRFDRAFTPMPTTFPSHAAMLTSLYPTQLGVRRNGDHLPDQALSLTQILRSKGYETAAFVSSSPMNGRYGLSRGFDRYDDTGEVPKRRGEDTVAAALTWLGQKRNGPFFLFVHLVDPHTPYHAPQAFRRRFDAPDEAMPPAYGFVANPSIFTLEKINACIRAYDAEIGHADAALGTLVGDLDKRGLGDSTVTIVVADHGESMGELLKRFGFAFDHGKFLYAHEIRVPLIVSLPPRLSAPAEVVHDLPVSLLDLMPTVLDLLGIDAPKRTAGRSLLPLIRGQKMLPVVLRAERRSFEQPPKRFLMGRGSAVLDWPWHLLTSDGTKPELFDLLSDPEETTDLTAGHARLAAKLAGDVRRWSLGLTPLWGAGLPEGDPDALGRLRALGYVQ
jgi:arylsulfatase A-like enzyme